MVTTPTREPGSDAGWRVIEAAVAAAHHRLGEGLASAYAIGSLAHGGFSPAASDVDLALLTTADGAIEMASVAAGISSEVCARVSGELAERLSVFQVPGHSSGRRRPGLGFLRSIVRNVADTATATGNHDAVEHYRAIPSATHVALADRALSWRATGHVDDRDTAAPLTTELFALHHEIFERLSQDQRLPRTAELADRAAQFAAWVTG